MSISCAIRSIRGWQHSCRSRLRAACSSSPSASLDSGRIEVAVADPADVDIEVLERVLGRSVDIVVGERSAISGRLALLAFRLEVTPGATLNRWIVALLQRRLSERGEPPYRAGQVWDWAARGVAGYTEMTNLPGELRAELAEFVPFSTLELTHEAKASDGTVKASVPHP